MAIRIECDGGCGTVTKDEADFVKFGHFDPGHYCADCAQTVSAHYTAKDSLHDSVAKKWRTGLNLLGTKWLKEHPGGTLPDGA